MNLKYIIIIGIAVIMMVAFGHNPVEEAQKQREAARAGSDPLVESIKEHNAKGGITGLMGGGAPSFSNQGYLPGNPGYQSSFGAPSQFTPSTQDPLASQSPASPDNTQNSYYPPPPLQTAPVEQNNRRRRELPPRGEVTPDIMQERHGALEKMLANGQRVYFLGAKVFTVDEKGRHVPMPDGVYASRGGNGKMVIRGGQNVISSN